MESFQVAGTGLNDVGIPIDTQGDRVIRFLSFVILKSVYFS